MKHFFPALFVLLTIVCTNAAHATDPFYPKPLAADILKFAAIDYGSDAGQTKLLNDTIFAMYHHNTDADFCAQMETFLLTELATAHGTPRYRAMLAQMVEAVGLRNHHALLAQLSDAEKDEAVRSRLAEAVAHWKRPTSLTTPEPALAVPEKIPPRARDQARLIDYLATHHAVPIPACLNLANLDATMQPRLAYALIARGDTGTQIATLNASTPALALAAGYAFSRNGDREHTLDQLLTYAALLDKEQTAQMAIYIAQAPGTGHRKQLAAALSSKSAAAAALAGASLAQMDLSKFGRTLLAGYDTADAAEKHTMLKVCESLADEYVFCELARRLPKQTEASLRTAMQHALMRISQALFTPPMFEAVAAAYAQPNEGGDAARIFWLRYAPLQSDEAALRLCKRAYADGLKNDAIKTLGAWKTPLALDTLVTLARSASGDRERQLSQTSIVTVMERAGANVKSLDYILKNALTPDTKAAALRAAVENPDKKLVEYLTQNDYPAEASEARRKLTK